MRRTNGGSRYNVPFRIVPERGKVAENAVAKGITVRESVVDLGFVERGEVTEEQLDTLLDVLSMTHPG